MLELRTLGTLDLRSPDGVKLHSVLLQPKRVAILVYLAVARPHGVHQRDELLPLFWPESDESSARHSLSQALYALRRSLGTDAFETAGRDGLAVDPAAVRCDAVGFQDAVDAGRWKEALQLYEGPFLHGFHLPDADGFGRWADGERERLRTRAAAAAWALAREELERGDPVEAERRARTAIRLLPTNEGAVKAFLGSLCDAGDRAGAVRFYRGWVALLAEELELEPSPEIAALAQELTGEHRSPSKPAGAPHVGEVQKPPLTPARTATGGRTQEQQREKWRPRRITDWTAAAALVVMGWLAFNLLSGAGEHRADPVLELSTAPGEARPAVERAVAVLPFDNISPDAEAVEWFVNGLRADICDRLMKLDALTVRPPETVRRVYGDGDRPLDEMASEIQVASLVTGSAQVVGDRFHLIVSLVDVKGDTALWQATYDGDYTMEPDVFDTQI
ncbi:MAG: hypothetical protein GWN71_38615, partial [Gammaproteobacteria bacterium]|nr:hypothetical protein [Gemmatimonadota bacterium]NIU79253.1 hypothetical protein [Gammaproteobacteria bacterium]NIT68563.1 hypothetical protein [Gemmatimonadota bacterium]NIV25275.1 hypothetical protein [Gemmatimonadota bacterium]NIW77281.1 hypothetical protein [Gemmatimonadota bacterium]